MNTFEYLTELRALVEKHAGADEEAQAKLVLLPAVIFLRYAIIHEGTDPEALWQLAKDTEEAVLAESD